MVVADDAAAALEPFDVDAIGDIPGEPHEKDQDDAEREREAEEIVRVFRGQRPSRECARSDQRQQQPTLPKVMLSPDSARMTKQVAVIQCTKRSKALKRTMLTPERPDWIRTMPRTRKKMISNDDHAEHRDGADPRQPYLVDTAATARPSAARSRRTWYPGWCRGPGCG